MGWLRLVGSLELQVSFAKEPYKIDDILQKRPIILRSLFIVATPYVAALALCESRNIHTYRCIHQIIGLFCRIQSLLQGSFAKETYDFKEPTTRSHPIAALALCESHDIHTYRCIRNICIDDTYAITYVHIYIYIYTYRHAKQTRARHMKQRQPYVRATIYIYIDVYMYIYIQMYIYIYIYIYIRIHMYVYMYKYISFLMCVCVWYTYI